MIIGILKEKPNESRVALMPEAVTALIKKKVDVLIESGAGNSSFASDEQYLAIGTKISSREEIMKNADLVVQISPPSDTDLNSLSERQVLLSVLNPLGEKAMVQSLLDKKLTSFSLDSIPRTSRAQAMDILSSQATSAGYRAVLDAAMHLPTFFPMFMTAAGTIPPAKVLILGAGVAGLQAVATAKRLGARVEVFDVRSAVKEEVESLGAKFVEVEGAKDEASAGGYAVEQTEEYKKKQQAIVQEHAIKSDVIISTAQIPGRKAPVLLFEDTVKQMKPGSVIIDLAASTGGNCELTENEKTIEKYGVTIIGQSAYASTIPVDSSRMFGKNVLNFLALIIDDEGNLNLNFDDDIVHGTCITHAGELYNERVKQIMNQN
ncbi:MAG: Re/Si-specific NAD(P)(+) transhydrogenase subunit alpha [Bacteroidota bacterium]|nr:Re/Si-specific NAD(P)(+) transhydrogenase subunit alpha [Bacteroidota bacterium]